MFHFSDSDTGGISQQWSVIISLAVVALLLLITLTCFCTLRRRQGTKKNVALSYHSSIGNSVDALCQSKWLVHSNDKKIYFLTYLPWYPAMQIVFAQFDLESSASTQKIFYLWCKQHNQRN